MADNGATQGLTLDSADSTNAASSFQNNLADPSVAGVPQQDQMKDLANVGNGPGSALATQQATKAGGAGGTAGKCGGGAAAGGGATTTTPAASGS
jgi:hypothetical protein